MQNETHVIQRQAHTANTSKPHITYMLVLEPYGFVEWTPHSTQATRYTLAIAGALAYGLNQEYEKTRLGPSYYAVQVV